MDGYIPFAPQWHKVFDTQVVGVGAQACSCLKLMSNLRFVDLVWVGLPWERWQQVYLFDTKPRDLAQFEYILQYNARLCIIITALADDPRAQVSTLIAQKARAKDMLTLAFVIKSPADGLVQLEPLKETVDSLFVLEQEADASVSYAVLDAVSSLVGSFHAKGFIETDFLDIRRVLRRERSHELGQAETVEQSDQPQADRPQAERPHEERAEAHGYGRFGQGKGQGKHCVEDALRAALQVMGVAPSDLKRAHSLLAIARVSCGCRIKPWERFNNQVQSFVEPDTDVQCCTLIDDNINDEDLIIVSLFITGRADSEEPSQYGASPTRR